VPDTLTGTRPRDVQHRAADWRDLAACVGTDPDLFFPPGISGPGAVQAEQAKAVCRRCGVAPACLRYAMGCGVTGVWGGTTEAERIEARRAAGHAGGAP